MKIASQLLFYLALHTLHAIQQALSNPVNHVPQKPTRSRRIESYFNLNTKSLDSLETSQSRSTVALEPGKLERLRPTMVKNGAEMNAMEAEHKRIEYLIEAVKKRDKILGDSLEEFYGHLKMPARARLYDLCTDSPLALCARHPAIQAPSPALTKPSSCEEAGTLSAPAHLIGRLFNCLGLDFLINQDETRISKIPRLSDSINSIPLQDEAPTRNSRTLGTLTCKNVNQEGVSKMKNEGEEIELHGEPLRIIQYMVSPLDDMWGRLESFMLCDLNLSAKDPLLAKWSANRHARLYNESRKLAISRGDIRRLNNMKKDWDMLYYVEAVFRLAEYISKYDLLPPNFISKIKILETNNLVPAIKFYITQSLRFQNQLMEILIWKPQGFIPGPKFLQTHEFFEPFHRPIKEKLTHQHEKILTYHLNKYIMKKLVRDTIMFHQDVNCQHFLRIHNGFCEEEFLENADKLHSILRSPRTTGDDKLNNVQNKQTVSTIQEILQCFDNPSSMQGKFHEYQLLNIYYMVHFLNSYYETLVDESIKTMETNILHLKKKINCMSCLTQPFNKNDQQKWIERGSEDDDGVELEIRKWREEFLFVFKKINHFSPKISPKFLKKVDPYEIEIKKKEPSDQHLFRFD
ncbi:hypothetical protein PGT21_033236 [Puccinia graminis f. sp. tritici]|uniref:Uncharacterized protein n=1 Tax=Puccinia graminis f. sp. tritici TaxID=56615 RepID=A0A5B0QKT5_PUCGR|nr:hypothetical protein PGT21_033236 [Puccinia graminis f. sp. tritici]